jgi:DNA mismatch repair ATPase MutS
MDLFDMGSTAPKKGQFNTLYDMLNCCVTPGGMRTLRSCLLQPCVDAEVINGRLDVIQELVRNQGVRTSATTNDNNLPKLQTLEKMRHVMTGLHDLHQVISFCVQTSMSEYESNREESRRVVRNKIMQV